MGLHPVAVELSKTTKMLDLGDLAAHYAGVADIALVYLGDSLQWETCGNRASITFGEMVTIPADGPANPIRLLQERFLQLLRYLLDYANRPEIPDGEANLLAVLKLAQPNRPGCSQRSLSPDPGVHRQRAQQYVAVAHRQPDPAPAPHQSTSIPHSGQPALDGVQSNGQCLPQVRR